MADSTPPLCTWTADTDPDLAGYNIYYGQQAGVYSGVQAVPAPATSFTMSMVKFNNDGVWNFAISAYDISGNESAKSTPKSRRVIRIQSTLIRHR